VSPFSSCCNKTKQKKGDGTCRPLLRSKKNQEKKVMATLLPSPFAMRKKKKGNGSVTFFFLLQQNKTKRR
jgi:hypothetical protein